MYVLNIPSFNILFHFIFLGMSASDFKVQIPRIRENLLARSIRGYSLGYVLLVIVNIKYTCALII